jgi:hypothetical protein
VTYWTHCGFTVFGVIDRRGFTGPAKQDARTLPVVSLFSLVGLDKGQPSIACLVTCSNRLSLKLSKYVVLVLLHLESGVQIGSNDAIGC